MKTVTCTKCPKKFTKPNTASADQALRMHVGRVHSRNIAPPNAHDGIVHLHGRNGKHPRSKLSREQASSIVGFIQTNRDRYPNKQACFNAALDELGLADRLNKTSTSTARYFEAHALNKAPFNGAVMVAIATAGVSINLS